MESARALCVRASQVKGLEYDVVVVHNFNRSYFDYYNTGARRDVCPTDIWVGAGLAALRCSAGRSGFQSGR